MDKKRDSAVVVLGLAVPARICVDRSRGCSHRIESDDHRFCPTCGALIHVIRTAPATEVIAGVEDTKCLLNCDAVYDHRTDHIMIGDVVSVDESNEVASGLTLLHGFELLSSNAVHNEAEARRVAESVGLDVGDAKYGLWVVH